jgi:predicted transcriptional regulator
MFIILPAFANLVLMRTASFFFAAATLLAAAAETRLGKPLALAQPTPIRTVLAKPAPYVGKIVQVKGKITEVCEMMGCWMSLADAGQSLRIKVDDGDIVFPKTAVGRQAIAEGKFVKFELTREQAIARGRPEAQEQGRPFHPESVKTGITVYQIQGQGAVILSE